MKKATSLMWMLMLVYAVSYITRDTYAAVLMEIESRTGFSRSALSLAVTGSFVTYGAGQLVSGAVSDRFSPFKLILGGLAATVILNLLIPLCSSPEQMALVWSVNGFAQAFMWPPIVNIMGSYMSQEEYVQANYLVNMSSQFGALVTYLVAPVLIAVLGWKSVFVVASLCGVVTAGLWGIYTAKRPVSPVEKREGLLSSQQGKAEPVKRVLWLILGLAAGVMVLNGALKQGVVTWMPSYMADVHGMRNEVAILSGGILPVFAVICMGLSNWLNMRFFKNPIACSATLWVICGVCLIILYTAMGNSAITSLLSFSIVIGAQYGVAMLVGGMVTLPFRKSGRMGLVSGILNSSAYIGSAVSTYGISILSENMGWGVTAGTWFLMAAGGMILCVVCIPPWKKKD